MSFSFPDALAAVASFFMTIELHICASHLSNDTFRDRRPNWDYEIRRSQAFLRRFGVDRGLPFNVQTTPNNTTWNVWMYTCHLGLAVILHSASVARAWVEPMQQVAQTLPNLNVSEFHISAVC